MVDSDVPPEELEESICSTYGDVISVRQDVDTVEVEFTSRGEPAVYAKRAVRERVGVDDAWSPSESVSEADSVWEFHYTGQEA